MKIQNQYKVLQNNSTIKTGKKRSAASAASAQPSASSQVQLSETASFVQELKEAAEQLSPEAIRPEVIEQARRDIKEGKLGSEEDYEQAVNALLSEPQDD
ncbi:MAG: hypothetical protein VX278_16800 [Myxococcota bacterium]|nr:hypothetical protein [Myxococcota bacterium]